MTVYFGDQVKCDEFELNLRRNRIMGGVIYFDMLYIPPQPKKVANWVICELEHPQVKHFTSIRIPM